ncbi:MAG: glucokinase [Gammaproteobacteria bacterium]|nr:glucokinase [Gammaproteobacteria bacterium]
MLILAGDIGGTKTILSLVESDGREHHTRIEQRFDSAAFSGLEPMVGELLARARPERPVVAACFAIAGPVHHRPEQQTATLTNLPWHLDSVALARALDVPRVRLINDFAGIAYGVDQLKVGDLETLQAGDPHAEGLRLVAGAGTGFGVCAAVPHAGELVVMPTEGGHAGFAPADAEEAELWAWVTEREGRCSREHLLSGAGIRRIFAFLRETRGMEPGEALAGALAAGDPAAVIGTAATNGSDPLAEQTIALFMRLYAGQLGDLALAHLARGGLYIAGGIAPKLLPFLQQPAFMQTFRHRPPMGALLDEIPVQVILNEHAGLIGAAHHATRLALQDATMV